MIASRFKCCCPDSFYNVSIHSSSPSDRIIVNWNDYTHGADPIYACGVVFTTSAPITLSGDENRLHYDICTDGRLPYTYNDPLGFVSSACSIISSRLNKQYEIISSSHVDLYYANAYVRFY